LIQEPEEDKKNSATKLQNLNQSLEGDRKKTQERKRKGKP